MSLRVARPSVDDSAEVVTQGAGSGGSGSRRLRWLGVVALGIVGAALAAAAVAYLALPAHSLPGFLPGHGLAKGRHRSWGAGAAVLAVIAWALAGGLGWSARRPVGRLAHSAAPTPSEASTWPAAPSRVVRPSQEISLDDILSPELVYPATAGQPLAARGSESVALTTRARWVIGVGMACLMLVLAGALYAVWNVNGPPAKPATFSTAVSAPAAGATVKGLVTLDASAVGSIGAKRVVFQVSGKALPKSLTLDTSPSLDGWIGYWDATGLPNGTYHVQSVAHGANGKQVSSHKITVSLQN